MDGSTPSKASSESPTPSLGLKQVFQIASTLLPRLMTSLIPGRKAADGLELHSQRLVSLEERYLKLDMKMEVMKSWNMMMTVMNLILLAHIVIG